MSLVLTVSILLRLFAVAVAIRAWLRLRDARILLFALVIALTGIRQFLTLLKLPSYWPLDFTPLHADEVVALVVSVGFLTAAFALERMLLDLRDKANLLREKVDAAERSEAALRESEQRFRDIAESTGDWFWETGVDHRFTRLDSSGENMSAAEPHRSIGLRHWECPGNQQPPDHPLWVGYRANLEAARPIRGLRFSFMDPGGGIHWYVASGRPRFDSGGRFIGYRGAIQEITAEVKAEESLRDSEVRYKTLVEESLQGIFVIQDYRPIYANQAVLDIFGYEMADFLALPTAELLHHPEDRKLMVDRYESRLSGQSVPERYEYRAVRKDGTPIWIETRPRSISWEGRPAVQAALIDITERKRAEFALLESEQRFRDISEAYGDWFWETDAEHRIVWVSTGVETVGIWKVAELYGSRPWDVTRASLPADDPAWVQIRENFDAHTHLTALRIPVLDPGAATHWIEVFGKPRFGRQGEFLGYRGTGRDITPQLETEEKQRRSEERYKALVEGSLQGIFVVQDYRIVFANQAVMDMFGYDMAEFLALPTTEPLYHPDDWEVICERYERRLAGLPVPDRYEYRGVCKDGSSIWIETHPHLIDWEGRPAVQAALIDITERKRAENDLRTSRSLLQIVFDTLPVWVIVRDLDLKFVLVNRSAAEGHELTPEAMIGQTLESLRFGTEEDRQWVDSANREVLEKGRTIRQEDRTLTLAGSRKRSFNIVRVPLRDNQGAVWGVLTVAEEVTEAHSLREQLNAAQRMDAIGRLAGGIAHDFNNLLAVIISYTEFLKEEMRGNASALSDAEEVHKAAQRAAALTRQLLAFSRRQVQRLEVLNLADLLKNMNKMLGRLIGEDIELHLKVAENLGPVLADASQIEQVVMNLAVNARDAMAGGGTLSIQASNVVLDEIDRQFRIDAAPGEFVQIMVSDTGTGMSNDVQLRIFEPFFTTKEKGKGTGLGLATVYGIVKQSHGTISIYSEPGQGTTFKVYLPRTDQTPAAAHSGERELPLRGDGTILLVEDEQAVRRSAQRILERAGYTVIEAAHGEQALEIAMGHPGPIDLLLSDVVMPKMSGPLLASRVTESRRDVKVLFMSGYTDDSIDHHGVLKSGIRLVEKPFSRESLLRAVHERLHAQG